MAPRTKVVQAAATACIVASILLRKKRKRSMWMKKWLQRRDRKSSYINIFNELRLENEEDLISYVQMSPDLFHQISVKVGNVIRKQDTIMRDSISVGQRLEATLRFLATGCSYTSLQFSTRISLSSLSHIIPETCEAIYQALKDEYMKFPATTEEWMHIADDFYRKWYFPNCLGAIDGKHITIRPPGGGGSYYFNYKGTHSIILLAVVDADYKFVYVDVGRNGRVSDGGVWDTCSLNKKLIRSGANIPVDKNLPNSNKKLPHVFVGDDAFPLKQYLMKPFPFQHQNNQQRIFSYRLSRARRVVENAFGILASRFRVLLNPIHLAPSKVEKIVLAATVLHNFLRVHKHAADIALDRENTFAGEVIAGAWRREPTMLELQRTGRRTTEAARNIRESFCEYFNNEGRVPWQERMVGIEEPM